MQIIHSKGTIEVEKQKKNNINKTVLKESNLAIDKKMTFLINKQLFNTNDRNGIPKFQ